MIYNTEFLKSNLCNYKDAYISFISHLHFIYITVTAAPATQVAFTNCASVIKCTSKTDETTIMMLKIYS